MKEDKGYYSLPLEDCLERISECVQRKKVIKAHIREHAQNEESWESNLMTLLCEYYSINNRYTEMAYCELPIITQNYETIDWYGTDKWLNFISSRNEAYETVVDIINNKSKYEEKSREFKEYIIKRSEIFFEKLNLLVDK